MLPAPAPVFNCAECSHYLPPGTLACPDCHAITYTRHVARIAHDAQTLEQEQKWPEARDTWHSALAWLPPEGPQADAIRTRIAQIVARLKSSEEQKSRWTKRLGPLAPAGLFLLKFKSAIFLLFKLKFLLSLLGFFALYWALWGWKFALGFTLSIAIHEFGHYFAARRRGLKVDLPVFLPGMGAYVRWYSMGIALPDLAAIALAGPFFGLVAALACLGLFFATRYTLFLGLAEIGGLLNIFNLTPFLGLDGAQAVLALTRLHRGLILISCLMVVALTQQYVYLFVAAGMAWQLFTPAPAEARTRTFVYFLLLLFALGTLRQAIPATAITR